MSLSPADLPAPLVTISGPFFGRAGKDLELICGVRVVEHLIAQNIDIIHVEWSGGSLGSGNGVMEHITHNGSYISNVLIFNPLLPSHGARYTCQARINISSIDLLKMGRDNRNVVVQSKLSTKSTTNTFWLSVNYMCAYNLEFSLPFTNQLVYFFTLQFPSLM